MYFRIPERDSEEIETPSEEIVEIPSDSDSDQQEVDGDDLDNDIESLASEPSTVALDDLNCDEQLPESDVEEMIANLHPIVPVYQDWWDEKTEYIVTEHIQDMLSYGGMPSFYPSVVKIHTYISEKVFWNEMHVRCQTTFDNSEWIYYENGVHLISKGYICSGDDVAYKLAPGERICHFCYGFLAVMDPFIAETKYRKVNDCYTYRLQRAQQILYHNKDTHFCKICNTAVFYVTGIREIACPCTLSIE